MTRDSCARELFAALDRLGVPDGRIDLPVVWPALATWWSTPVTDLAPSQEEGLTFLLSLAPADRQADACVFAGAPPDALAGRDLVCLDFEREFKDRVGPHSRVGIGGGAAVSFWYEYDSAWQRLRERSEWIEMGISTPQIDAFTDGRDPGTLIRYVERESGVLEAASQQHALALVVYHDEGSQEPLVLGEPRAVSDPAQRGEEAGSTRFRRASS